MWTDTGKGDFVKYHHSLFTISTDLGQLDRKHCQINFTQPVLMLEHAGMSQNGPLSFASVNNLFNKCGSNIFDKNVVKRKKSDI